MKKRQRETAKTNDERDVLLLTKGNVAYRMNDMLKRRRNSALAGQHRETQRLDKEIMLLRAALGLPKMPPKEVVRTQRLAKDPVNGENLAISSDGGTVISPALSDVEWAKRVTVRNLARVATALYDRGYEYASTKEGDITRHSWRGFRGSQPDDLQVATIGRSWTVAAIRNGHRLPVFEFSKDEDSVKKGIPVQMTASQWDGNIDTSTRQAYASGWAKLISEL